MLSARALRETPVIDTARDLRLPKRLHDLFRSGSELRCGSKLKVPSIEERKLKVDDIL